MNKIISKFGAKTFVVLAFMVFAHLFQTTLFAQQTAEKQAENKQTAVKVSLIDDAKFRELLKPKNGKPLLINFWATWCEPCREEFPDLVKIDADYRGKIDFITVSLDFEEELNRAVPQFLAQMKAEMPGYLLVSANEDAMISSVSKDWSGGLPFTVLYNEKGEVAYLRQGKVKPDVLRVEIDKILLPKMGETSILELPKPKALSVEDGKEEAKNDIAKGILKIKRYGFTPGVSQNSIDEFKKKYGIEITGTGCLLPVNTTAEYFTAYNETMKAEIIKRFGVKILEKLPL